MDSLKPLLLTSLKSYSRSQFFKDVTAGIIVTIIALPLSNALALASGVGLEAGIFSNLNGPVPFRKPDQVYPLHDHNRIHFWNRCHNRDRTTQRFLQTYLSQRCKTYRNNRENGCRDPELLYN